VGEGEIAEEEVMELAELVKNRSAEESVSLTFFEFVTVMALIYFARRKVDVAVVEVGLGGRLDATNLVLPRVSIITTISKDHEAYLGSDLLSIAREKGGIIKKGIPVVCGSLPQGVGELLKEMAEAKGSASYFLGRDVSFTLKEGGCFDYRGLEWNLTDLALALRGRYQRANAAVVLNALEVTSRDFPVGEKAVREGLERVSWPGRFEVMLSRPTVILDGAHNGEGIKALVSEVRAFEDGKKVRLLFGAMRDKDWPLMLRELGTVSSEAVLTRVPMERSVDPREMAQAFPYAIPATIIDDPREAMRFLLDNADPGDIILVTGSLYLLGQVRPLLANAKCKIKIPDRAH
jgi:dihydrofolate synthase/folylpolyglutamate synthase